MRKIEILSFRFHIFELFKYIIGFYIFPSLQLLKMSKVERVMLESEEEMEHEDEDIQRESLYLDN